MTQCRAEDGETYFYITFNMKVDSMTEVDDGVDALAYNSGNYFKTRDEAEAMAEKFRAILNEHHEAKEGCAELHDKKSKKQSTMNKFYMIYVEGGNAPTFAHKTMDSALEEAKRLAKLTGKKAYILESVKSVQLHEFDIEDLVTEPDFEGDIPF